MCIRDSVDSIRDWINAGAPESARVLPVNLLEFSTDKLDDNNIIIFWKTASEINTSHFELETSIDGVHFSFLVKLAADGSELAGGFYQHIFKDPKKGFNYFRMKIVDFDNSYIYSPVRVERIINVNEVFNISPVPTFNNTPFNVEWLSLIHISLTFTNVADYDKIRQDDQISILGFEDMEPGKNLTIHLQHKDGMSEDFEVSHTYNQAQIDWVKWGSCLLYTSRCV